tara:strand:- start:2504 stop:2785 length:282 start_codon:yes stop_codon:yes gene_type:complete
MIGNRTRRNFKKGLETTYKIGKYGLPVLVRLVLPGGKVVTGVQAAKKLAQYKRVKKGLEARKMRRAKKMEAGEDIRMDGSKLSDFLKKIGVEQ